MAATKHTYLQCGCHLILWADPDEYFDISTVEAADISGFSLCWAHRKIYAKLDKGKLLEALDKALAMIDPSSNEDYKDLKEISDAIWR